VLFALGYYGVAIYWISFVTKLGLMLLLLYLSLYYVVFFLIVRYFLNKHLKIITIPCLWIILEFIRENVWCGFSWANLGYSQYRNLYLIQAIDIFGAKFISFLVIMVNILIWEIVCHLHKNRTISLKMILGKVSSVVLIFLICFSYSFYRLNKTKETECIETTVIQPNIPQALKWEHTVSPYIVDKLNILGKKAKRDALVIFPEAAWPFTIDSESYYELAEFVEDIKRDSVLGAVVENNELFYNTALLFDSKGRLKDYYRKIKLVPFGEYVPLRRFLRFVNVINSIGDMSRGEEMTRFSYKNTSFSVLICFEDIFPLYVLKLARNNDFLINITNDAWFKGEPQASQHLGIMVFRAVENRISIVRSANTGMSGWVSFMGRIEMFKKDNKHLFIDGVNDFKVSLNKKRSFYNKYGDFFPILCFIFLLFVFIENNLKKH